MGKGLDVPYQQDNWVIEEEEPGEPITQFTRVAVGLHEKKTLDIAAVHGGSVTGHVEGIRSRWANDTFVVAFTRGGLCFEAPVAPDARFAFPQLPPGEYGLKAGHDAFMDAERPPEVFPDDDSEYSALADPWKRAAIVRVEPDRTTPDVQLQLPKH